jgi:hypothetical protein
MAKRRNRSINQSALGDRRFRRLPASRQPTSRPLNVQADPRSAVAVASSDSLAMLIVNLLSQLRASGRF